MTRSIAGLSVGLTTGLALLALSSTSVLALEAAVAPNVSAATAIAAATSFDPNFKPTAGVRRPAGESSRARMRSANASSVASSAAE